MNKIWIIHLFILAVLLVSCDDNDSVTPSGNVTTVTYEISGYDAIDVSSAFDVQVDFSQSDQMVQIDANENLHQFIEVFESNNTLFIKLRDNTSIQGNSTLRARITEESISSFKATGASAITVNDSIEATDVTINLTGASFFTGGVYSSNLVVELTGASAIDLNGSTVNYTMIATGASSINGFDMVADNLFANLTGASNVNVTVNEEITIVATGASNLNYKGDAVIISQNLTGASTVNKLN